MNASKTPTSEKVTRRKFVRISTQVEHGLAQVFVGAQLKWSNGETSKVFDLSYKGAAVGRPKGLDLKACHFYSVEIVFSEGESLEVRTEVMWFDDHVVGLFFDQMGAQDHSRLTAFLKDKLIGANLRLVDPKFYKSTHTFTHWYQGPGEVQVQIWQDTENDSVQRLEIHRDGSSFTYNQGMISVGGGSDGGEVQSLYESDDDGADHEGVAVSPSQRETLLAALGILTQLQFSQELLNPVFDQLTRVLVGAGTSQGVAQHG